MIEIGQYGLDNMIVGCTSAGVKPVIQPIRAKNINKSSPF